MFRLASDMKVPFITIIITLFSIHGNCQAFEKEYLTKNDEEKGVFLKFNYTAEDSYGVINLILMKDSTFLYSINTNVNHGVSEGKWTMSKNILMLESTFQTDNVPVEISCDNNRQFVDSSSIAIVENIKRELLTDVFVLVNEDSIKCLPMIAKCNGSFEKINRVKVVFENGMSSKWIVVKGDKKKVAITVLTDVSIRNYIIINKQRFRLDGKYLRQQ